MNRVLHAIKSRSSSLRESLPTELLRSCNSLQKKCTVAGGFELAIFLVTAFRAACTAIELLAALHSSFEKLVLPAALRACGELLFGGFTILHFGKERGDSIRNEETPFALVTSILSLARLPVACLPVYLIIFSVSAHSPVKYPEIPRNYLLPNQSVPSYP